MPKDTAHVTDTPEAPVEAAVEPNIPDDWQPQQTDTETGVFMTGDYPTNHRLRAEALARARRKTDPDGIVSPELIADTAERLRAEREAE